MCNKIWNKSLSYHANRGAGFTVCYHEVYLATDNIFVTLRNEIYKYINCSSPHLLHLSERKQACYSLFAGCSWSKFLPTREQQRSSQHEKLSRAVDSRGCIPNWWRYHGHKPESCQPLGRHGFCMTTQGNLGEWSISRPKLWVHQSLLCDGGQITIVYHGLIQDASIVNLYGLHCTFGCIIEINQISDYLQKWTLFILDCANLSIVSWKSVDKMFKSDKNC